MTFSGSMRSIARNWTSPQADLVRAETRQQLWNDLDQLFRLLVRGLPERYLSSDVRSKLGSGAPGNFGRVRNVSADHIIVRDDDWAVIADATSAAITVTLPAPARAFDKATRRSRMFKVVKADGSLNLVTVVSAGGATIIGVPTVALAVRYEAIDFFTDGTEWFIG